MLCALLKFVIIFFKKENEKLITFLKYFKLFSIYENGMEKII